MIISFDSSVSSSRQAVIETALTESLFPFDFVNMALTFEIAPLASHGGEAFNAVTTVDNSGSYPTAFWEQTAGFGSAITKISSGIFESGDPLYQGDAWIKETVLHEMGHVMSLGIQGKAQWEDYCTMFGISYANDWDPPDALTSFTGWQHSGREAVAETFKDFYARPSNRKYTNRTDFQLPAWAQPYFVGETAANLAYGVGPIYGGPSFMYDYLGKNYQYFIIPPMDPQAMGAFIYETASGVYAGEVARGIYAEVPLAANLGTQDGSVESGLPNYYVVSLPDAIPLTAWPNFTGTALYSVPPFPLVQQWQYPLAGASGLSSVNSGGYSKGVVS